ncbi:MAG: EamA family transporter [Hyphomicrobiaceae bacterium]|nr:MAG: EamA family transporter [Hyphomicrobiaceae bacterium]
MDPIVFMAVLLAAAFHAGWNALLKIKLEPLIALSLVSAACGLFGGILIFFAPPPAPASWIYIVASLVIHLGYYLALSESYRHGELSQIYPIARGTAPLLTAVAAFLWLGEELGFLGWLGVAVIGGGVLMLSLRRKNDLARFHGRSVTFALLTAVTIMLYTLADGTGARLSDSPIAYIGWLFLLDGVMMLAFGMVYAKGKMIEGMRSSWGLVLAGGFLSTTAYGIAIWAMTKAPIALVATLRETSVLFAAMIGVVFLKEPLLPSRAIAAVLVVIGAVLLRMR